MPLGPSHTIQAAIQTTSPLGNHCIVPYLQVSVVINSVNMQAEPEGEIFI